MTPIEIGSFNRLIFIKELEKIIEELPHKKSTRSDGFSGEIYQVFTDQLILMLYNLFQNTGKEEMLSEYFYEAKIALIPVIGCKK